MALSMAVSLEMAMERDHFPDPIFGARYGCMLNPGGIKKMQKVVYTQIAYQ